MTETETSPSRPFLAAWHEHENAPRTPCPICHFESSEGYPESHAPGCEREQSGHSSATPNPNERSTT